MVICNVAKILELVIPLMDNPSETFLTTLEEDLMKLIIKYGMTVSVIYSVQLSPLALEEGVDETTASRFKHDVICCVCFPGCPTLCKLPRCCCQQGHTQLQVCLGLFQSLLW